MCEQAQLLQPRASSAIIPPPHQQQPTQCHGQAPQVPQPPLGRHATHPRQRRRGVGTIPDPSRVVAHVHLRRSHLVLKPGHSGEEVLVLLCELPQGWQELELALVAVDVLRSGQGRVRGECEPGK